MSKTDSLHYQLCLEGAKWLRRKKRNYEKCKSKECHLPEFCRICDSYKYVAVELVVYGAENTDVWGYNTFNTAVIEVKVSHQDFLADKNKWWRSEEASNLNLQAGKLRYYLCPEGVIKPEELPEKWGLLYWDGKKIKYVVGPKPFENHEHADLRILSSILRRENFPEKIFNYRYTNEKFYPKEDEEEKEQYTADEAIEYMEPKIRDMFKKEAPSE